MYFPILNTKLYAPQLPVRFIHRDRIIRLLNEGLEMRCRVTLVAAPAGYGKTTIIAEWSKSLGNPRFSWLSLDHGDNDPALFFAYLTASLAKMNSSLGLRVQSLLQMTPLPPGESLIMELINEITELHPDHQDRFLYALVLDDYQVIQDERIHRAVEFLIEHQPALLHLVIITRRDPPFPLPRLRVRGQLTEIRSEDLRMTMDEAQLFLQQMIRMQVDHEIVTALERRTEGWIAGLQMAALAIRSRINKSTAMPQNSKLDNTATLMDFASSFAGNQHHVIDYLASEILRLQPETVQKFLVKTAILDRFSAPLSDAVCERKDSQAIISQLERDNLFLVPLDERREWYRYHHLFRDFLLTETEPTERRDLNRRAASWFEDLGYFSEAVEYILASGDVAETSRIILRASLPTMQSGEYETLLRWLEVLPDTLVRSGVEPATLKALALFNAGQLEAAKSYVHSAGTGLHSEISDDHRGRYLCLQTYLAFVDKDYRGAVQFAQEALKLLDEDNGYFRSACLISMGHSQQELGNDREAIYTLINAKKVAEETKNGYAQVYATGILARTYNEQGQRREALSLCKQVIERFVDHRGAPIPLTGYLYIQLGNLYYEANELELANQSLRKGILFCEETAQTGSILGGKHRLAYLLHAQGEVDLALETIGEIRQFASQAKLFSYASNFAALEEYFQLIKGNLFSVERWGHETFQDLSQPLDPIRDQEYLTHTRFLLAKSKDREALSLLERLEHLMRQCGRDRILITIYILASIAEWTLGRQKESVHHLEEALRLAAPENYIRAFLDECWEPKIRERLLAILPRLSHLAPEFIGEVTNSARAGGKSVSQPPLIEPLNQREYEILKLIADGLSNQEIADILVLSLNTIKWHLQHLYAKLGTQSRTKAISRARDLHLL